MKRFLSKFQQMSENEIYTYKVYGFLTFLYVLECVFWYYLKHVNYVTAHFIFGAYMLGVLGFTVIQFMKKGNSFQKTQVVLIFFFILLTIISFFIYDLVHLFI